MGNVDTPKYLLWTVFGISNYFTFKNQKFTVLQKKYNCSSLYLLIDSRKGEKKIVYFPVTGRVIP